MAKTVMLQPTATKKSSTQGEKKNLENVQSTSSVFHQGHGRFRQRNGGGREEVN